MMPVVNVPLGQRRYPVVIGAGSLNQLEGRAGAVINGGRIYVIYDARLFALHGRRIQSHLKPFGNRVVELAVPPGERTKSAAVLNRLYEFFFDHGISRSDLILACGGGMTSDLAGYAAATVLRGVRWGIVSTTLLGMVDAAIGGKTGINHPLGKNLIGAFWQPSFVLCDTGFLSTLPRRQMVAGLGEVLKYGGLVGEPVLSAVDGYLNREDLFHQKYLSRLIHMSVTYKAGVVARDERDRGERLFLNLGHTFAHALENAVGYGKLLHGEAVTLGLFAAVELSRQLRPSRAKHLDGYRRIIMKVMALVPYRTVGWRDLRRSMQLDKKRSGAQPRFVLLDRPGRPFIAGDVCSELAAQSFNEMVKAHKSVRGRNAANPGR